MKKASGKIFFVANTFDAKYSFTPCMSSIIFLPEIYV